jgi:hypothetical protein
VKELSDADGISEIEAVLEESAQKAEKIAAEKEAAKAADEEEAA